MSMTDNYQLPPTNGGLEEWFRENKTTAYVGGAGLIILAYLYYKNKQSSSSSASTTGNTGSTGTTGSLGSLGTPSQAPVYLLGPNNNSPSLASLPVDANQLYQQLQNQQTQISQILSKLGNTPAAGGTTTPSGSSTGSTPPVSTPTVSTPPVITPPVSTPPVSTPPVSTPSFIPPSNSLIRNGAPGETSFVSSVYNPAANVVYSLTNDGGVYTTNPVTGAVSSGPFFGSAFSIGQGGNNLFSSGKIALNSSGGYSITNNQGQTFNFT